MRRVSVKYGHIAGDDLLDLLNTVEWRLGGPDRRERLTTFSDVLDWSTESHLTSQEEEQRLRRQASLEPAAAERERRLVIEVRELAYAALRTGDAKAGATLADAYTQAVSTATLELGDDRWRWRDRTLELSSPRHRITRGLVDLARRDDLDRLHQCEDVKCGWLYLDNSPRRNRRWCNSKDCGDRNRARAYYARKKNSAQTA